MHANTFKGSLNQSFYKGNNNAGDSLFEKSNLHQGETNYSTTGPGGPDFQQSLIIEVPSEHMPKRSRVRKAHQSMNFHQQTSPPQTAGE